MPLGIREYAELPQDEFGREVPVGKEPPIATGVLTIGSSVTTLTFNSRTRFVRLHTDAICNIDIGETPAPYQGGPGRMAADQTEYFGVAVGAGHGVGVITDT